MAAEDEVGHGVAVFVLHGADLLGRVRVMRQHEHRARVGGVLELEGAGAERGRIGAADDENGRVVHHGAVRGVFKQRHAAERAVLIQSLHADVCVAGDGVDSAGHGKAGKAGEEGFARGLQPIVDGGAALLRLRAEQVGQRHAGVVAAQQHDVRVRLAQRLHQLHGVAGALLAGDLEIRGEQHARALQKRRKAADIRVHIVHVHDARARVAINPQRRQHKQHEQRKQALQMKPLFLSFSFCHSSSKSWANVSRETFGKSGAKMFHVKHSRSNSLLGIAT